MLTVAGLVGLACLLAGVTVSVGLLNLWTYSQRRELRGQLWLGVLALSLVLVLLSGAASLLRLPSEAKEATLFVRAATLGISALFALPALAWLAPGLHVKAAVWLLGAVVVVRMALWLTTDLVLVHDLPDQGWPRYGPLAWTGLVYGFGLLGVAIAAARRSQATVRHLLAVAVVSSLAMVVVTTIAHSGLVFEALLSLSAVPGAACVLWLGAGQVVHTARARDLLLVRQSMLAEMGRFAIGVADVQLVREKAERLLRGHGGWADAVVAVDAHNRSQSGDDRASTEVVRGRRYTVTARGTAADDRAASEFVRSLLQVVAACADRAGADADLAHNATHDPLTGLPNRLLLLDRVSERLHLGATEQVVAFLVGVIGLDELISFEGHEAADTVIRRVATGLGQVVTEAGTFGRVASDVFAIVESTSPGDPSSFLRHRLAELDRAKTTLAGLPRRVTVAVGAVVAPPGAKPEDLLRDGTAAMRRAATGARGAEIFDAELRVRLKARAEMEEALRHVVTRDEIEVHYQPIVDGRRRAVMSYEALARWRHDGRLIPPVEWIPVAEDAQLISAIGLHVLRIACRDQRLLEAGVAVNVSPYQLADEQFGQQVIAALGRCPSDRLTLEVTESALMSDIGRAVRTLRRLRDVGVRVALDDFGTSYSSLSVMSTLPLDILKLDRAFIQQVETSAGAAMVSAVVALAGAVGMTTIAEGVETEGQFVAVAALGVDRIQGFLTGRPAPLAFWSTAKVPGSQVPARKQ